jgi:hypothetical protein
MSQNELRFTHYGKDYKPDIVTLPDAELKALQIDPKDKYLAPFNKALQIDPKDKYLAPFNPAIYSKYYGPDIEKLSDAELKARYIGPKARYPVRIAFFGLNAHSHDNFEGALRARNWIESFQDEYKKKGSKLPNVLQLWHDGLPKTYFTDDSAIYYSNFVKIVLREKFQDDSGHEKSFVPGATIKRTLEKKCDKTLTLFKQLAKEEVTELSNNGCHLFICFGKVVDDFMRIIREDSASENIWWRKEEHFSYRYRNEELTKESIQAACKWLKNTKRA